MNTVQSIAPISTTQQGGDLVAFPGKAMDLPKPLVAAHTDLRDFQFMPLDVVRFRDSDFTALIGAEAFRAGVILWCAAWHQIPAASLPDDDRVLANLAGYGRVVSAWLEVKESALHGWIKCSDGRLYHPVVAEKANEAYESKLKHRYKLFTDRIRKKNLKLPTECHVNIPDMKLWIDSDCPSDWENPEEINHSNGIPTEFQWNSNGKKDNSKDVVKNSNGIPTENALKGQGQLRDRDSDINTTSGSGGRTPLAFVRYEVENRKSYKFDELLAETPNLKDDFFGMARMITEMPNMSDAVLDSAWTKISMWAAQAERKSPHKWMVTWVSRFVRDEYDSQIQHVEKGKNDFTFGDLAMQSMTNGGYNRE